MDLYALLREKEAENREQKAGKADSARYGTVFCDDGGILCRGSVGAAVLAGGSWVWSHTADLPDLYSGPQPPGQKAEKIYAKYSTKEPHETNAMNKVMTWYGINMKTMMDKSNSKIAELLLQGTNMGIIEGRKLLNNKNMDREVHDLLQEFVTMQEDWVEVLKKYL